MSPVPRSKIRATHQTLNEAFMRGSEIYDIPDNLFFRLITFFFEKYCLKGLTGEEIRITVPVLSANKSILIRFRFIQFVRAIVRHKNKKAIEVIAEGWADRCFAALVQCRLQLVRPRW